MGLSVGAHKAGPVYGKYDRKVLYAYIMQDLVVCPLKEGRIYRNYRSQPACCQSCREGYRMLLRYSDIEKPVMIHIAEPLEPGPVGHGGRNCHHLVIPGSELAHYGRENVRIIGLFSFPERKPRLYLEGLSTVKPCRMALCRKIAPALLCYHMDQNTLGKLARLLKHLYHSLNVMTVHRSKICDTHILKEHARDNQLLHTALIALERIHQLLSSAQLVKPVLKHDLEILVCFGCPDLTQILGHTSDILGYRHIVVVKYDDVIAI